MEKKLVQPDGRLENPLLRSILSSTFSIFSFWILEVFLSSIKTRADTFIAFQQFYYVLNCCCETLEQQNTTLFSYQISYLKIHVQAKKIQPKHTLSECNCFNFKENLSFEIYSKHIQYLLVPQQTSKSPQNLFLFESGGIFRLLSFK